MDRRLLHLLYVALIVGLCACGESTRVDVAVGAYVLVTVDSDPLPWVAQDNVDVKLLLVSAFLHVFPDDCRFDATWHVTFADGTVNVDVARYDCTWSRDGSDVTITGPGDTPGTSIGTIDQNGLSLMRPDIGIVFYYERLR